jgi:hypothetical protein
VTVTNSGRDAVRVRSTVSDWHLSRDGSPQFVEDADGRYSATPWVRVAPPEIVVDAGAEVIVRFTLAVPAEASPAGYRTGILFEFAPVNGPAVPKAHEVQVRSRIATLIYANVGEPPAAIELTDLQPRVLPGQPGQIVAVLKNTSKRTVRTRGTLTLYDRTGVAVSQTLVPDVPVLPESEREVATAAVNPDKGALPPGDYRVEIKIDVGMAAVIVGETTFKVQ